MKTQTEVRATAWIAFTVVGLMVTHTAKFTMALLQDEEKRKHLDGTSPASPQV